MNGRYVLAAFLAFLVLGASTFAVGVTPAAERRPVPFDDTLTMSGLTLAERQQAQAAGWDVPHAQVFYSQYRYVVGYEGISTLVAELNREGHERQFGLPLAIFVTDYGDTDVSLTDEGYIVIPGGRVTGWVAAEDAYFVVNSSARTPGGPATMPFADRSEAQAFADRYGGDVRDWAWVSRQDVPGSRPTLEAMRPLVEERTEWADDTVAAADALYERPVSVTVGEDADTVAAAIEMAPPNTTVFVPAGEYDVGTLTVDKPLTIRGAGQNETGLHGAGTGTVLTLKAPKSAVTALSIDGVGETKTPTDVPVNESAWDYLIRKTYGYADSGIVFDTAPGSAVRDVFVDTPTNGIVVRDSDDVVVDDVTVHGRSPWVEGFMNVLLVNSRTVVQDSTFVEGRDAVYTHVSHGSIIRNNSMRDFRFAVHEMYTSDALVSGNVARDTGTGVVVMTHPEGNVVLNNDVRDSDMGIDLAGSSSYVVGNVLAHNSFGLDVSSERSLYARNVVYENRYGVTAGTMIPTNRVVQNDFVGNREYAEAVLGPLRVWSDDEGGNYWEGAPGVDGDGDGIVDRSFYPTGPVDGRAHRASGSHTLALSPAVTLLRWQGDQVPGLRPTGVLDAAPLANPVRPDVLAELNETEGER